MQAQATFSRALAPLAVAASLLASCSGGGGSAHATGTVPAANTPLPSSPGTSSSSATTKLTISIDRRPTPPRRTARLRLRSGTRGSLTATRRPAYVSASAKGLQIVVTSASATQTVAADISTTSPLCAVQQGYLYVCTLSVPTTLGAANTIVATEIDQQPTGENSSTGMGTGFPNAANVLAVGSTAVTPQPGTTTPVSLALDPVPGYVDDCGGFSVVNGVEYPSVPATSGQYERLPVTAGVSARGIVSLGLEDVDRAVISDPVALPGGLPYSDVNGAATPVTASSSANSVTLAQDLNPDPAGTPEPAELFSSSAAIATDAYETTEVDDSYSTPYLSFFVDYDFDYDGGAAPVTITVANELTATTLFNPSPYTSSFSFIVDPISVSTQQLSLSVSSGQSASVTGSDPGSVNGLAAYSAPGGTLNACMSGSTTLATITAAAYNATTETQQFTVTPVATGTCSFVLIDQDAYPGFPGVPTLPVTVTVGA